MSVPVHTQILIFLAGILVVILKREVALKVYLIAVTLIPYGNMILIGPASFYPMRIFAIFGFLRILIKREKMNGPFNNVDWFVMLWAVVMLITGALRPKIDTTFMSQLGETYNVFLTYFVFRFMIQSHEEVLGLFKTLGLIFSILAIVMLIEKVKGYNYFSYLGGVSPLSAIRDGRLRCQGPFAHPILAGTVGATVAACNIVLFWQKDVKKFYVFIGTIASLMIVVLSASSGPIMSFVFVLVGFAAWPMRRNMRFINWGIFLSLLLLHLVMKAPVWFLIARIDLTGSSTGWHRAELIDSAIRHFNEWWLMGTSYTRHWMPTGVTWSPNHTDITNHYIKQGVNGGLFTMLFFIFMISSSFKMLGKKLSELPDTLFHQKIFIWALGASLFSHTLTFLTIRYFDQSMVYFYMLLAMIGCVFNIDYIKNENEFAEIKYFKND